MTEILMIANEPNQKAIDAGSAALLRLSDDYVELAKATAHQMAKDGSYDDWRVCLAPACALVVQVAKKEALYHATAFRDIYANFMPEA